MEQKNEDTIQSISQTYFICRNEFSLISFSSGHIDYYNPFYLFYRDVEIALSLLNEEEKMIIQNEYFTRSNPKWWESFYSKKKYEIKKEKAVKKFVRLFHEIH